MLIPNYHALSTRPPLTSNQCMKTALNERRGKKNLTMRLHWVRKVEERK